jgi:hypothetical protein
MDASPYSSVRHPINGVGYNYGVSVDAYDFFIRVLHGPCGLCVAGPPDFSYLEGLGLASEVGVLALQF